jgi:hypothetical protein
MRVDPKPFVKELEWMRRQPKAEQRNLNRQTIFMILKKSTKSPKRK